MLDYVVDFQRRLQFAFREALALPPTYNVPSAESRSLSQWDSVGHLQLVVAIETAFDVQLNPGDVLDLQSYSDAIGILRRHGVTASD